MRAAVFVVVTLLVATGCSDDEGMTRDGFAESLVEQGLFDEDHADCIADAVFDDLDDDEVEPSWEALRRGEDAPPAMRSALVDAVGDCVEIGDEDEQP